MKALAEMTPVEIDTILAENWNKQAPLKFRIYRCRMALADKTQTRWHASSEKALVECQVKLEGLREEASPYETEYKSRPWKRYYRVTNVGGHIHRELNCHTCFFSTEYAWVIDLSDCDETEMVATYGEMACTVCFPDAPTLSGYGDGTSYMAKLTKDQKDAKAAAKQAKRDKQVYHPGREDASYPWFKTERGAELTANDQLARAIELQFAIDHDRERGDHYPNLIEVAKAEGMAVVHALAVKHGVTDDEELARLAPAIWRKAKRETKWMR